MYIKQNFDCTYSVCDSQNHSLHTFRDYNEAQKYIQCLMGTPSNEPKTKSKAEIKREERKTKLKKLFNFD